jgi:MFS superfamily sulfate permease-like transporter
VGAAGVTLVGFTDTVLTGRAFRRHHDATVDPQAELRAMSLSNVVAGLFQGMAVSSSGSRTALARSSRATSQGYSLVAAAGVVLVLFFAAPALSVLPKAGLAALVIYAALNLIEVGEFRALWSFSRIEFALALITAVAVLAVGILNGVLVAVALSVLAMLARVARPHAAALGFVRGLAGMHDIEDFDDVGEVPGLLVYRYDSPLFFANAEDFKRGVLEAVEEREPQVRWCALNCEAIVSIDSTAAAVFSSLVRDVQEAGMTFCLVRAKRELIAELDRAGILPVIGDSHVFPTLPTLVQAFRDAYPEAQPE